VQRTHSRLAHIANRPGNDPLREEKTEMLKIAAKDHAQHKRPCSPNQKTTNEAPPLTLSASILTSSAIPGKIFE
jgi:hypothetical protein